MKIEGLLKLFIDGLESEVGSLYYDEDIDVSEDTIRLELEDSPDVVVEIDTLLDHMNVYRVFSYYDFHKDERESAELEEIEQEIAKYYEQKDFEKALSASYNIDIWEDGCWGCPCYEVFVGLQNVKCDIEIVKGFLEIYSSAFLSEVPDNFSDIRKHRLESLFGKYFNDPNLSISERKNIDYAPIEDSRVLSYVGKEYVLLRNNLENAAIKKCYYDIFAEFIEEIEYFSDYRTEIYPEYIRYVTCSYVIDIARVDEISAIKSETLHFDLILNKFLLFASDENLATLAKTFVENNVQTKDMERLFSPHLYTEGQTDCIHIKNALKASHLFRDKTWIFDENKSKKGDRELLNLCMTYGNDQEATCARIAIFDRDESIPLKDIEDEGKGFKEWGNRMYSFALPVPKHRESTPKISIEHYYSDEELFREYDINGVMRRLYIGCEFDNIGRSTKIRKLRKTPNKCGPESIAILDSDVYDMDSDSEIDYALSKSQFAEKICGSKLSIEAASAFNKLFLKIMEVLKHDEERNRK